MGTGITSALVTNFPYGGGSAPLRWVGFGLFALNLILFVFVCGCTIARYLMFPEVCTRRTELILRLISFPLGVGIDVESPGSKPIYRLLPYGRYNIDQRRSRELLRQFIRALITLFRF